MNHHFINGRLFTDMVFSGAEYLESNVEEINALNVFPVPDGDTGTNMNLTMSAGIEQLRKRTGLGIGQTADVLAKGLLMGARGNSGVILSQLFRGFSRAISDKDQIDAMEFALAFQRGVDTAYEAVVRPVEGTILTVARESAKQAVQSARRLKNITELMKVILDKAKESLANTPNLLPVLKQVGVVDSGGQGLVVIYEGFLATLEGKAFDTTPERIHVPTHIANQIEQSAVDELFAQAHFDADSIEYGYCTEFIVQLEEGRPNQFEERVFRNKLEEYGDSLLVVADDDLVKVHIHAEEPGTVMNYAMQFGSLTRIKIENMREQHGEIMQQAQVRNDEGASSESSQEATTSLSLGMITVAAGEGLVDIFKSLGVNEVLAGGQTMNPSTEDLVHAIERVGANKVIVLPNNSNIVMAAEQAKEVLQPRIQVEVVPTKTIQQGFTAALAFQPNSSMEENVEQMIRAVSEVRSGQVTHSIRDSEIDGLVIKEGDYLGMLDNRILFSEKDLGQVCISLLDQMMDEDGEMITVLVGAEATKEATERLANHIHESYPDAEVEFHTGDQPVYYYLISVE